jgi:glycosyl hydrolase family 115
LSAYYNHTLAGGKWDHVMDQTHIGYTFWNEPPVNTMPKVTQIELPAGADMGIAVEGSALAWPGAPGQPTLPQFDAFDQQSFYVDSFNRGRAPFTFTTSTSQPWIHVSEVHGGVDQEKRIWISVDWLHAPEGLANDSVSISSSSGQQVAVKLDAFRSAALSPQELDGFVGADGYVSIEAVHYTKKVDGASARWEKIDDLGRTLSAMSMFPVTAKSVSPAANAPCLEYKMYVFHPGTAVVEAILDPTLNFVPGRRLRYAVSFDEESPQMIDALADKSSEAWSTSVKDAVRKARSTHVIGNPGYHTLKFWMVDPGVVLQKLVVDFGGVRPSYLGPPESYHRIGSTPPSH